MIEFVENINPWIYLTIGVAFIILDVLAFNSETLMWIGGSFFGVGILKYFDASGLVLLSSFPIFLLIFLFGARKLILKSSPKKNSSLVGNVVGAKGRIIKISSSEEKMAVAEIEGHGEWNIRTNSEIELFVGKSVEVIEMKVNYLLVNQIN